MRHEVFARISERELDGIAHPDAEQRARHLTVERHVEELETRLDLRHNLSGREREGMMRGLRPADWRRDGGRVCGNTFHQRHLWWSSLRAQLRRQRQARRGAGGDASEGAEECAAIHRG